MRCAAFVVSLLAFERRFANPADQGKTVSASTFEQISIPRPLPERRYGNSTGSFNAALSSAGLRREKGRSVNGLLSLSGGPACS
jgi:hypothetical protein